MKKLLLLIAGLLITGMSCGGPKSADQAYHDYLMAIKEANGNKLYNLLTPEAQNKLDEIAATIDASEKQKPEVKAGRKYLDESLKNCRADGEFSDMTDHITDDLIKRLTPMGEIKEDEAVFPGALGEKAVFEKRDDGWRLKDEDTTTLVDRMEKVNTRVKGKNEASELH